MCIVAAVGCGGTGSDLEPGSGDDPGSGTSTLTVDGVMTAKPRLVNARNSGDFETSLSVRVMLGLQAVTGGRVTVTSSSGTVALIYRPDENRWQGTSAGYDEVYVLDIESGADAVTGVRVDGPDLHFFTAPMIGATVDSTLPLEVKWDSDETADSTSIDTEEIDRFAIPDTGAYVLAAGTLRAESDQTRVNGIELVRANRVTPAGAAGGSEMVVAIENHIEVVVQPNPAL